MRDLAFCVLACIAGQFAAEAWSQQPGDTPAPVVLPSGGLYASIDCPEVVQAGSVITFDVSGTSDGDVEIEILHVSAPGRPAVPTRAIVFDTSGEFAYAWLAKPGHYVALWTVLEGKHSDMDAAAFEVVGAEIPVPPPGDDPPDVPDDPPPTDTAFTAYVKALTLKVEAENHREISATFRGIAARIDQGELRGSLAIQTATLRAVFGPSPQTLNREWKAWYADLFDHLLNVNRLSTQRQWAEAYRTIAAVIDT